MYGVVLFDWVGCPKETMTKNWRGHRQYLQRKGRHEQSHVARTFTSFHGWRPQPNQLHNALSDFYVSLHHSLPNSFAVLVSLHHARDRLLVFEMIFEDFVNDNKKQSKLSRQSTALILPAVALRPMFVTTHNIVDTMLNHGITQDQVLVSSHPRTSSRDRKQLSILNSAIVFFLVKMTFIIQDRWHCLNQEKVPLCDRQRM
jgi:hypothetical protein